MAKPTGDAAAVGFVVARYLMGARGEDLLRDLSGSPYESALPLAKQLASEQQGERAQALAKGLVPIIAALQARQIGH